ncbi:MAG: bis(5'-nucleosyl)-tetraphosphatase (symmetrical) YqeK [Alicyclobacillus sp.]|nr:bis(5'-nucleosyl)-tetraphosphatase (symmetrical) YqeK [Alicyclobacillus sp.]
MSPGRFQHTMGVVAAAEQLAQVHGADTQAARLAGWIHDLAREWPEARLREHLDSLKLPEAMRGLPAVWHGPVAASVAAKQLAVQQTDVLQAVFYHTTGRPGMGLLEKVLCVADATEPGRRYPGVERLRELANTDLDQALAESLDASLRYLLDRRLPICLLTVAARNEVWQQLRLRSGGAAQTAAGETDTGEAQA